ncbi:ABC transporter permease [Ancylobacter sp. A5.8]|uniref:ABC transporter permease n=1 Tax=Ancylobacter gelatini TaxID=2919920 RepID=UPI001F4EA045|nr:ABC transporter permease [Ancylobacter gelatini]MCJ8142295.1 ABC transporter permease [Ancylobacter gelatini]
MSKATLDPHTAAVARPGHRGFKIDPTAALALPAVLYLVAAYAIPLAILLFAAFRTPEGLSLANFAGFFADAYNWQVTYNTLWSAGMSTLACLVIGYPTAVALARSRGVVQMALLVSLILPLSVGVVVKAFAWTIMLRTNGILNQALLGIGLIDAPLRLLFTPTGLVIGAVNVFLPFMILPIYSVLRLVDARLPEAAATLGAGPVYRFFHVLLPLTLPGIIAGVAFVFSLTVSMYVVPNLLMGEQFMTLPRLVARSYLYFRNEALGSTIAVILLVIAVAVVMGSQYLIRLTRHET